MCVYIHLHIPAHTHTCVSACACAPGELAELVKHLLSNHKDLSSIPRAHVFFNREQSVHAYNPGIEEVETGGAGAHFISELRASKRPCLKSIRWITNENDRLTSGLHSVATHMYTHTEERK